jgi:ubiquinol-cytochrome c reductase cytochrome c subunit
MLLAAAAALAMPAFGQTGAVENGKRLFLKNGCWQCHGYAGQGGLNGARLAQTKLSQSGFLAFVRNPPSGGMPPYRVKVMTDQELADVYAYVKTFPEPPKNVPLLDP